MEYIVTLVIIFALRPFFKLCGVDLDLWNLG